MKLYTPTEIAAFVSTHDLGDASEREVIDCLKRWEREMTAGDEATPSQALFAARRDAVRADSGRLPV